MNIQEIRQKYPDYNDLSDEQLADALHSKYYSDLPKEQVYKKIGYIKQPEEPYLKKIGRSALAGVYGLGKKTLDTPHDLAQMLQSGLQNASLFSQVGQYLTPQTKLQSIGDFASKVPVTKEHNFRKELGGNDNPTLSEKLVEGLLKNADLAALGGKGIYELGKKGLNAAESLTSKSIANKIIEGKKEAKGLYSNKYNEFFDKAKAAGINKIEKPKMNLALIQKNSRPKYHQQLLEFTNNPTLENAHWAQSDLGKYVRHMEKVGATNSLSSTQIKAVNEAEKIQSKLKEAMFNNKQLGNKPELAKEYNSISAGYSKEVVPYSSANALSKYEAGKLSEKDLVKRLNKDYAFMTAFKKQYPQIKINQMLKSEASKKLLYGLLTGTGIGTGAAIAYQKS